MKLRVEHDIISRAHMTRVIAHADVSSCLFRWLEDEPKAIQRESILAGVRDRLREAGEIYAVEATTAEILAELYHCDTDEVDAARVAKIERAVELVWRDRT